MAEYIEREALERILETKYERLAAMRPDFYAGFSVAAEVVRNETTNADVVPVVHGKWEKAEDDYYGLNIIKCSLCHEEWCFEVEDDVIDLNYKYCPNCGAKMDLED